MKFFAILHKPTGKLFPHLEFGSTTYDFHAPDDRRRKRAFPRPPRLFGNRGLAQRYITEYCKGERCPSSFANAVTYLNPPSPRSVYEFDIIEINIELKETA